MGQTNFSALGLKPERAVAQTLYSAVINATTVFDPASLATVTGALSSGITVTGAALGDIVQVSAPYDLQGIIAQGFVSAANTIKISLFNPTAGTIDLASGTWKIKVLRG
jgi:hypothetical protein